MSGRLTRGRLLKYKATAPPPPPPPPFPMAREAAPNPPNIRWVPSTRLGRTWVWEIGQDVGQQGKKMGQWEEKEKNTGFASSCFYRSYVWFKISWVAVAYFFFTSRNIIILYQICIDHLCKGICPVSPNPWWDPPVYLAVLKPANLHQFKTQDWKCLQHGIWPVESPVVDAALGSLELDQPLEQSRSVPT